MRISDWSSDVCSSDLADAAGGRRLIARLVVGFLGSARAFRHRSSFHAAFGGTLAQAPQRPPEATFTRFHMFPAFPTRSSSRPSVLPKLSLPGLSRQRSEEHTSELQSLLRI